MNTVCYEAQDMDLRMIINFNSILLTLLIFLLSERITFELCFCWRLLLLISSDRFFQNLSKLIE